jgi:hypothetical protein
MEKVVVRPVESTDLPGVDKLRILAYPHLPEARYVDWHSSIWRWLESHPLADQMYRWILVTEEGEVVGHLAATPQYYRVNGQRVIAHTPADYQVLPRYGFHALLLMRKFFRTVQNCVACDMMPAVIRVETRLGAEVAGDLHYAAKLFNVSRLPVPPIPSPIKRLLGIKEQTVPTRGYENQFGAVPLDEEQEAPPPMRPRVPLPAPVKDLLNGGLQVIDEVLGVAFGGSLKVEVLEGFDESFDELFEKIAAVVPCLPEKDAAFLRWRYGPGSPQAPITILGVRGEEGLLGYAVLEVTAKNRDGFRDAYILDLVTLPGRRDVARALLRESVRHFRRSGAPLIRYRFLMSPTSPQSSDLWRFGFFYRNKRRNTLLVKFADRGLHKVANDAANWSYSIGDGEATFWVRGRNFDR